ncbi:MAG: 4Fe-4S binding protein [Anaerolineales bacterium]|nr:4Fe-4S binding protein [Anaerolineales bacterium]
MAYPKRIYDLILQLWPLVGAGFRMGNWPGVGALVRPFLGSRYNHATIIPVNEAIERPASTALPYTLLQSLIEQSSAHFIMNACICRSKEDCQAYPHTLGCLFLGHGAAMIHSSLGRSVSAEAAVEHLQKAMNAGLVPLVAHTIYDSILLNVPFRRTLTICFCCDCCCAVRRGLRMGPPSFREVVQRLPGLHFTVGDECVECGACIGVCPVGAISLNCTRAVIADHCVGCGLCLDVCPNGAIHVQQAQDDEIIQRLMDRISQRTDIRSNGKVSGDQGLQT